MTEESGPFIPSDLRPEVGPPSDAPVPEPGATEDELARLAHEAIPPERREQLGLRPPAAGEIDWATTVVPSPDLTTQELDGEVLILDLATSQYYSLNDVGTVMWGLLSEGNTLEQVAAAIRQRYDSTEAQVRGDLASLVQELEQKGLVRLQAPNGQPEQP
jgi:hypothetical protein